MGRPLVDWPGKPISMRVADWMMARPLDGEMIHLDSPALLEKNLEYEEKIS